MLIASLTAMLAFFRACLGLLRGSFELHSEHLAKKTFTHLREMGPYVATGSSNHVFLQNAMTAEIFRIISKIDTSPIRARALMEIFNRGDLSLKQLRGIAKMVHVSEGGSVDVEITFLDRCAAWLSALLSLMVILSSALYAILLSSPGKPLGIAASLIMMIAGFFLSMTILSEYKKFKLAIQLKHRLAASSMNH